MGSIGGSSLQFDQKERQILGQARIVDALVGGGAGGLVADLIGREQAKRERRSTDRALAKIDSLTTQCKTDAKKLTGSQRSQYHTLTKQSENERSTLISSRNTLSRINCSSKL